MANATGALTSRNEYNAFGELSTANLNNLPSNNAIGYTGQRLDGETGLMALGNGERYYSPAYARFIQQDSFVGNAMTPQSLNRFAYVHNNPNKFTDPTGHWIESAWDVFSLGLGVYSFQDNIRQGNYLSAAIDGVGIVADTAALILPIIPGGVGAAIKAYRAVDKAVTLIQTTDRAINTMQATYNAGEAFGQGDIKSGLLNTGFAMFGAKSTLVSAGDFRKIENATNAAEAATDIGKAAQKSGGEAAEILSAKNDPKALTGIFQKEAKAQKAEMMDDIKARDNVVTDYSELARQRIAESRAKYGNGGNWARGTITTQKMSGFGNAGETETAGANPAYKTTAYYSALGGVRQLTDALSRVTSVANDGFNRPTAININGEFSETRRYDGEGLLTGYTDKRGVSAEMTYDELGRKTATRVFGTASAPVNIEAQKTIYDDAANTELHETAANAAGSRNPVTYVYDGLRRVKQITNAAGDAKSYKYDGENLTEESDFYNQTGTRRTRYVYDALDRVREIYDRNNGHTVIEYNASDLMKTVTDRRGNVSVEIADALGRTISASDAEGKLASFTYDGGGNRLTQQDGNNNQTSFEYDKLNRLTVITHPNGLQTETITYDAAGNVKTHADGRGGIVESLEYDALDQLKKAKDGAGNISEFTYDGGGLLLSKKDPKLNVTSYAYNAFGSLTQVAEPQQAAWTLSYDAAQNMTAVRDPLNRTTAYEYDAQNRLTKTTQPLGRTTEYAYDKNSNVRAITDPKGQRTVMTYDALDRLATASYQASGFQQREYQYNYDAEDNLWRVYDSRTGEGSRISTRSYDRRSRVTQTTDALGKSVGFAFDAANNLTALTAGNQQTRYDYDAKNQLDRVKQNGVQVADYDWFSDGLLEKVSYQNGTTRNYQYDNADRVATITNNFTGNQNESFDYGYDANSNRTSEVKKANGQAFRTIAYGYDGLDRLTSADYLSNVPEPPTPPLGSQISYNELTEQNTFAYDAVGNRINEINRTQTKTVTITNTVGGVTRQEQTVTSPEATTTATYNDLNELTQLNEPNGISNFTYDDNGNLTEIRKNSVAVSRYEYDIRNQLTKAKDGLNNELARFDYDFERKRVAKTNALGTTNYVYAGNQIVSEFANNATLANYTIGAGEIVKSEFSSGENNYHFTDALGSVTSLANTANGSLTSRSEYNAFGEVATNGASSNAIGYTGQRLDNETGLMALGNGERYYSPAYARFIQQDSWLGNSSMPQSTNRFSYAYNNPFSFTDPSGNQGVFSNGTRWTNNDSLNWWIDFTGSSIIEANSPTKEKLGQSLELWNEWALGVGDAFKMVGGGIGDFAGGVIYGDAGKTMGDAWAGVKQFASDAWNVVSNPIDSASMLGDVAMNDPKIFMRGLGQSSGETVIAAATTKAGSPVTKPAMSAIKKTAVSTGSRILAKAGETTAGKAATRIATETVERAGTRLSSAVESVGQKTTALKQSVGETWQKIKGADEPKKRSPQRETAAEFVESRKGWNFYKFESDLKDVKS